MNRTGFEPSLAFKDKHPATNPETEIYVLRESGRKTEQRSTKLCLGGNDIIPAAQAKRVVKFKLSQIRQSGTEWTEWTVRVRRRWPHTRDNGVMWRKSTKIEDKIEIITDLKKEQDFF